MATSNDDHEHEDGYDADGFAVGDEQPSSRNGEPTTARVNFAERTGKPLTKRERERAARQAGKSSEKGGQSKPPAETVGSQANKKPAAKKGGRKATREEAEQATDAFLAMFDGATSVMLNRPDAALSEEELGIIRERMVRVFQRMNPVATSKYQAITDPLMIGVGFFFWYQRLATTAPTIKRDEPPYTQPAQGQENANGNNEPTGASASLFASRPSTTGA